MRMDSVTDSTTQVVVLDVLAMAALLMLGHMSFDVFEHRHQAAFVRDNGQG